MKHKDGRTIKIKKETGKGEKERRGEKAVRKNQREGGREEALYNERTTKKKKKSKHIDGNKIETKNE